MSSGPDRSDQFTTDCRETFRRTVPRLWHNKFDIVIIPHPDLSPGQQAVVPKDYGMSDGRAVICVRYAMLFYVLKRFGLLDGARVRDPRTQHIVAENEGDLSVALARAQYEFDEATPGDYSA